jgi:hypothetical protein
MHGLTEPDPWYGLPIFTGLLLYVNVEIAKGKQSLGGEASARSNIFHHRTIIMTFNRVAVNMVKILSGGRSDIFYTSFVLKIAKVTSGQDA